MCPHCENRCNCTVCSRRRGETYVPQDRKRVILPDYLTAPIPQPPPLAKSTSTSTSGQSKALNQRSSTTEKVPRQQHVPDLPAPPTPSIDLPEGSFWATIYGPDGLPLGQGFVGDDHNQIIVRSGEGPGLEPSSEPARDTRPKKKRRPHSPVEHIGKLRDRWRPTPSKASPPLVTTNPTPPLPRAYIGRRMTLFERSWKSMDELASLLNQRDKPPSSDPSNPALDSSPRGPLPNERMGFLLAEILGKADPPTL